MIPSHRFANINLQLWVCRAGQKLKWWHVARAATLKFSPTEEPSPGGFGAFQKLLEIPLALLWIQRALPEPHHTWGLFQPLNPSPWHPQLQEGSEPLPALPQRFQTMLPRFMTPGGNCSSTGLCHSPLGHRSDLHPQFQPLEKARFSTSQSNRQLPRDKPDTNYQIWTANVLGIRDAQKRDSEIATVSANAKWNPENWCYPKCQVSWWNIWISFQDKWHQPRKKKIPSKYLRVWKLHKITQKPTWERCEKLIICSFLSFSIWMNSWNFPCGFPILLGCSEEDTTGTVR